MILVHTILHCCHIALLSSICIVLDHSLLKNCPKPHTFIDVRLDLVVSLSTFRHFDVFSQFFNLPFFLLHLVFHVPVLPF